MKVYMLTEADFEALIDAIERDPERGSHGKGIPLTKAESDAHFEAHRFYNFHVRSWIDKVKK